MKQLKRTPFAKILDWLEGKLSEAEAKRVAEDLAIADEDTQADLNWLRDFLQTSQEIKLASPPPEVREVLRRRFAGYAEQRSPPGFLQLLQASMTFDSRAQTAAAGLRSAGAEGLQRQLIYNTEVAEIALNIQPRTQDQRLDLFGQVFPDADIPPDAFSVQLLFNAVEAGLTTTDDLGEFAFEGLPQGEYEIILSTDQFEVLIPNIRLQA